MHGATLCSQQATCAIEAGGSRKRSTPNKLLTGKTPDLALGTPASTHIARGQRDRKVDDHSKLVISVGHPDDRPAWRIFNLQTGKYRESRNVTFLDRQRYNSSNTPNGHLPPLVPDAAYSMGEEWKEK